MQNLVDVRLEAQRSLKFALSLMAAMLQTSINLLRHFILFPKTAEQIPGKDRALTDSNQHWTRA